MLFERLTHVIRSQGRTLNPSYGLSPTLEAPQAYFLFAFLMKDARATHRGTMLCVVPPPQMLRLHGSDSF
jgi:hypothetical protein